MADSPLITTIVPTYQRPQLLKRALRSVLRQTYPHFQVCVYDNASGDESAAVVQALARQDARVKYYCHPRNVGAGANFQFGLTRVDTPYFSFLSDDDFLLPGFYETALEGFQRFPDIAFSAGSVVTMTEKGKIIYVPFSLWDRDEYVAPPDGVLKTIGARYPIWTGILFRRSVIDDIGLLDLEVGASDLDFVYRIAAHYPFVISKQACAVCVSHTSSFSYVPDLSIMFPGWLRMIRNITEDSRVPQDIRDVFERRLLAELKKMVFRIGIKSITVGKYNQAREAATILRDHLKRKAGAQTIAALRNACERSSLVQRLFAVGVDIMRFNLNPNRVRLQKEYGHLSSWLRQG